LYKNFLKLKKYKLIGVFKKMKAVMKIFVVILSLVLTLGLFFTQKSYADYPPNYKIEYVNMDGQTWKIIYNQDGGIVEIIIDNRD
jgi:hypothetical protein